MKKPIRLLLFCFGLSFSFQACNPDCESVETANLSLEPKAILPGTEFLVRASSPDFLKGKKLFINDPNGGSALMPLESTREEDLLQGIVAKMPVNAAVNTNVFVEDPDCGGFLLIEPIEVRSEDFFYFSDIFVVPPTPFIFIPTPAVSAPPNITNAWITPYRRSYCIWFVPRKDSNGKELKELRPRKETDLQDGFTQFGSHEFVVCGSIGEPERHSNANVNPVSGYVDKEKNDIMIRIDRTSKGLGVETFTGLFVNPGDQLPFDDEWRKGGSCGSRKGEAKCFMLLTSQNTGQQILLIKVVPQAEDDCT